MRILTSRLIHEETPVKASLTPPLQTALELKLRGGTESGKHLTTPEPTITATVLALRAFSPSDRSGVPATAHHGDRFSLLLMPPGPANPRRARTCRPPLPLTIARALSPSRRRPCSPTWPTARQMKWVLASTQYCFLPLKWLAARWFRCMYGAEESRKHGSHAS